MPKIRAWHRASPPGTDALPLLPARLAQPAPALASTAPPAPLPPRPLSGPPVSLSRFPCRPHPLLALSHSLLIPRLCSDIGYQQRSPYRFRAQLFTLSGRPTANIARLRANTLCRGVSRLEVAPATPAMASSNGRKAKLRRIHGACTAPHNQLAKLVATLREEEDLHDVLHVDRKGLDRAIDGLWNIVGQPEVLPCCTKGETFSWSTCSLPRLLQHVVENSPAWAREFRLAWERQPCSPDSPFHVLVYCDEATPGNVLRLDNKRKVFAVYCTVQEFRPEAVKHDCMWLPVACIRSSAAKSVKGGVAAAVRRLYRRWLLEDNLGDAGVLLDLALPGSRYANVYFAAGPLIADADAIRAVFSCKGASGKVPCILCKNVINDAAAAASSDYLVDLTCGDARLCDFATDADIWEKVDSLQDQQAALTKSSFEALQMAYGLTFNADSLLYDAELRAHLRPCSLIRYDAMHCVLSNGIAQHEMALLLDALRAHSIGWEQLRAFAASDLQFHRAGGGAPSLRDCFSVAREKAFKDNGSFKAGAAEMLMVLPVVLFFLETVVSTAGVREDQILSFKELWRTQQCIRRGKDGRCDANELASAIRDHAAAFGKAYGPKVKPKNHFLLHLPSQLNKDQVIYDAFVGERKHIQVKRAAEAVKKTTQFERTVLMRCLAQQMSTVSDPSFLQDGLVAPQSFPDLAVARGYSQAHLSKRMYWHGTCISLGDCLLLRDQVHIVKACGEFDGQLHLAVETCEFVEQVARGRGPRTPPSTFCRQPRPGSAASAARPRPAPPGNPASSAPSAPFCTSRPAARGHVGSVPLETGTARHQPDERDGFAASPCGLLVRGFGLPGLCVLKRSAYRWGSMQRRKQRSPRAPVPRTVAHATENLKS